MSLPAPSRFRRARAATGLTLAVALGSVACSGSEARPRPPTTVAAPSEIRFGTTGAEVHAAGPTTSLPDDVRHGVTATLDRYLATAVLAPLRTGAPAPPELGELFTGSAVPRLSGPDRAALVDEGLPRARRGVWPQTVTAHLTALTAPDGSVILVAARVDLALRAALAGGDVAIVRQGDLVLAAENGAWRIDGYDLRVTRDSGEGTTTTAEARR